MLRFIRRLGQLTAASALAALMVGSALGDGVTPLVSTSWLKTHFADADLVVLDIRSAVDGGGAAAYDKAHIPGSVHSDYDKAGWRVTRNGLPFMLPTTAQLEKLIGELGIDEDSHVIVVPAGVHALDFGSAARVYWTLKVAGVAKVSILDGGIAAWMADPTNLVASGRSSPSPKIFTATLDKALVAEATDVQQIERAGGATLVDARPASFFLGKEKAPGAKAYGHIRGAINLDNANFYDTKTNRLKNPAELAALAARVPAGPLVSYCNTGHWAATNWFVLSQILGREVRLYYGSMVEWTSDASRPIESVRTKWDDLKKTLGLGT
jgi:thiosulfate/3-mercaptopyruvate sulfurtransferase